jgi:gas vesicle protein
MSDETRGAGFLFGLLVGAVMGASFAMLLAPQSGEETREMLREKADVARRRARELADNFKDDAEEWVEKGKKYVDEAKHQMMAKKQKMEETTTPQPQ